MAIVQGMTASFKVELLQGLHDFSAAGHTFKIALYTSAADLNATTTDYTASNEVSGTGYAAGGQELTNVDPSSSGTVAFADFSDETFSGATFTTRGALIYNTTAGGGAGTTNSVLVLDFGTDKTVTAGDFTIQFPTADATSAIIRID